jgi:sodium-dependent dicarboxylate transporter 2/3/5
MFLGGLILALAIEHSGLHQRLALKIMLFVGTSPKFILLGFMITTGSKHRSGQKMLAKTT